MSWPNCELRIEVHPTNPPRPLSIIVMADGRPMAALSIEQLRDAVAKWDEIAKAAQASGEK